MAGPDDLLLMLVQHWARDESVFPTEDDRHDVATVMLFSSLIGIITLVIGLLRAMPEHRAGVICFLYFHVQSAIAENPCIWCNHNPTPQNAPFTVSLSAFL